MVKKSGTKNLSRNKRSPTSPSILIIFLFIMGLLIAEQINFYQDDATTTIVFLTFLIMINIGLFRYLGLHRAFKRTPRIKYWKLKQKGNFGLYLIMFFIMIGKLFAHVDFLALLIVLGLLFIGIGLLVKRNKIFNTFLHSIFNKGAKLAHIEIREVDKMTGTEFELFLAKIYEQLGYYSEVTPHTDYGIDVIIQKDKIRSGIQAKCYGEGRSVGVKAINEVSGGAGYWKVQKKMVITNRYFTKQAFISANANNIELIDRDGLQSLIMDYHQAIEKKANFSFSPFLNRWKQG